MCNECLSKYWDAQFFYIKKKNYKNDKINVKIACIFLFCFIECYPGTYGAGCNATCGYCINNEACLHTNGTCAQGCDPGYKGELCNACKLIFVTFKIGVNFNVDIS